MTDQANQTRRALLTAGGTVGVGLLAGCLGGESEEITVDYDEFPDFDPLDPEYPQPAGRLIEEGFARASIEELEENFEPRDEPRYGRAPRDPDEADEIIDPDPLVFAWTPGEEQQVYEEGLDPLVENIEAETGREVEVQVIDSYAAMVEAFRSERLHIARVAAGNVPFAVNMTGAVPFAMPYGDDTFGNRLWVITRIDNDEINTVDDLVGRDVVHTEQTSGSGHLEPSLYLEEQEGIVPGEDYEITFSGGHFRSVRGIYLGDYEVGPVAGPIPEVMDDDDEITAEELKVIWAGPFARPLGPMCYQYNLPKEVREGIERAHFEYDYGDTDLYEIVNRFDTFAPIDYATHYDPVLQVQKEQEIEYAEDEIEDD